MNKNYNGNGKLRTTAKLDINADELHEQPNFRGRFRETTANLKTIVKRRNDKLKG